jgi:MFS transporter, DHA2 family, multidrug resistance protein
MSGAATHETPNRGILTLCVMLATIMQALDTTIANVALPYMQGNLSATQDQINWVLTSYIVAAAIMTPVTGFLAARLGRKRLFLIAVAGFTIASVLCGIAQSLPQMVLFRLAQGVFGAPLVPMSQSVLLDSYPREKHGSAMAMWGVGVMVGPILGPTLGGWLTEYYNWRWVFYINVPIGILTFLGLSAFLSETKRQALSFDWFGFAALSIAVGALQLFLDRGEQLDWFGSREIIGELTISVVAFYMFLVHTFTSERPFINPGIFKDRNFSVGLFFIFIVGIILLASLALLTPYLQNLMNYPVLTAGMVLAPRGIGTMVAMMIVGRIINRIDPRVLVLFGLVLTASVLWEMTGFTPEVSRFTLVRTGIEQGLGLGFLFVPLSTITFATLTPEFRTQGTALFSLMRNLGSSIGISVVIFLLTRNTQVVHSQLVEHVTPFNEALRTGAVHRIWNMTTALGRAALHAEITRQAAIIAYIDDYKFMMLIALAAVPIVFLLRKGGPQADAGQAVLE